MQSRRLQKINKHIQRTFGEILVKEADLPPDVLVTISRVETTHNLQSSKVWLYIYPTERAEEVIEKLTPQLYDLQGAFNRELDARPLPRLLLRVDYGADKAESLNRKIDEANPSSDEPPENG